MSLSQLSTTPGHLSRRAQESPNSRYLKTPDAARYLGVSVSWLNKSRVSGTGPVFVRFGKAVVYAVDDLDDFAAARRVRSTSEKSEAA